MPISVFFHAKLIRTTSTTRREPRRHGCNAIQTTGANTETRTRSTSNAIVYDRSNVTQGPRGTPLQRWTCQFQILHCHQVFIVFVWSQMRELPRWTSGRLKSLCTRVIPCHAPILQRDDVIGKRSGTKYRIAHRRSQDPLRGIQIVAFIKGMITVMTTAL
jgi:hypothetical protein